MEKELPEFLRKVIARYPGVWEHYAGLNQEIRSIEAIEKRNQHLVKLGIAIGAGREGAVHSHTRRAKEAGASNEQLFHVALLAVTTIGWSGAMAALSWINDCVHDL